MEHIERESMEFDVVIVGAGPAGLSAAIKIRQLAIENNLNDLSVCVVEKGSEVGAHIPVSYIHLRAHDTEADIECRLMY